MAGAHRAPQEGRRGGGGRGWADSGSYKGLGRSSGMRRHGNSDKGRALLAGITLLSHLLIVGLGLFMLINLPEIL